MVTGGVLRLGGASKGAGEERDGGERVDKVEKGREKEEWQGDRDGREQTRGQQMGTKGPGGRDWGGHKGQKLRMHKKGVNRQGDTGVQR